MFTVRDSIKDLEPVLRKWLTLVERCDVYLPQRSDSWYVERTLTSLLSSAAWLAEVPSLVEVKITKQDPSIIWNGHADLWIGARKGPVLVESKIAWLSRHTKIGLLGDALNLAAIDAARLPHQASRRRLGIAFGVFSESASWTPEVIEAVVKQLEDDPAIDVVACAPPSFAPDASYAGCILVGRLA